MTAELIEQMIPKISRIKPGEAIDTMARTLEK